MCKRASNKEQTDPQIQLHKMTEIDSHEDDQNFGDFLYCSIFLKSSMWAVPGWAKRIFIVTWMNNIIDTHSEMTMGHLF